ncbi:MAG: archease [Candidatus Micrarchaeia archaeon]
MDKFVFLEHTADVLFESSGFSFEEALENAALAMFSTIADADKLSTLKDVEVEERAETLEELAAYTLSDLLYEGQSNELFFKDFKITEFKKAGQGYLLKGRARGSPMNPQTGKTDVKAVTHHECKVRQDEKLWKIKVLLDT